MESPTHTRICIVAAFVTGVILTMGINLVYLNPAKQQKDFYLNPFDEEEQSAESHREPTPPPIVDGIEGCIGNTPLIRIRSLSEATGCEILAKAEFLNGAGGSPKDRVALNMIQEAEAKGLLVPFRGDSIYEGTVGSTGISLATLARARGYLAHICMPSDQALEKGYLLEKLGAIVDKVPPAPIVENGHFVNRARSLAKLHDATSEDIESMMSEAAGKKSQGFFADQFENPANWEAHYKTTGPEIFTQCEGKIDAFVAGAGTGGTISGVARFLKPRIPNISVVLADPQGSGLYNRIKYGVMFDIKEREGTRRRHQVDSIVEGIGINRVTANFEAGRPLVDDAVRVKDIEAIEMARFLVEKDGIFVGSSSAVNCFAAVKTAQKLGPGHRIVTILCDSGARHISKFWAEAGSVGGKTGTKLEDFINKYRDP
ncbi:hypothetical protein FQN57_005453 [Myotisia sp. PD_48]|nr:hypothetical protein FQN57_005453 [Myotisia sp. PD_48]